MPTYVYRCQNCDARSEAFQKMTEDPLTTCEACGGTLRRVVQPVGIVFKGSGFYVTDYKRADTGSNGKSADSDSNGKSADTASKPESTETKPVAAKTEKAEKPEPAKPVGAAS